MDSPVCPGRHVDSRAVTITARALLQLGIAAAVAFALAGGVATSGPAARADSPVRFQTEPNPGGGEFVFVVFHALDRDGFCSVPPGAVSLHPVLGLPVDFLIEAGDGIIIASSDGAAGPGISA